MALTRAELIARLVAVDDHAPEAQAVLVVLQGQGAIGATPGVAIASVESGFDWDNGRVLLRTERPLTDLTPEQVQDIAASVRKGGSWHAFQAHKKQAEEIADLRKQIADLQRKAEIADRALCLADRGMFEVLECDGVLLDEHGKLYGLTDASCCEVATLAEASEELREAVEWLRERGFVELVDGPDGEQSVVVLRALD